MALEPRRGSGPGPCANPTRRRHWSARDSAGRAARDDRPAAVILL